jgi:hypothetical protein
MNQYVETFAAAFNTSGWPRPAMNYPTFTQTKLVLINNLIHAPTKFRKLPNKS